LSICPSVCLSRSGIILTKEDHAVFAIEAVVLEVYSFGDVSPPARQIPILLAVEKPTFAAIELRQQQDDVIAHDDLKPTMYATTPYR